MQTTRLVQAVILMMIVALAASCAASKEYTSRLFAPRTPEVKDSQVATLRFLDLDSAETNKEGWVTTDIIMGRDTVSKTLALDKLAKTFPSSPITTDTMSKTGQIKPTAPIVAETKSADEDGQPVARNINTGEVRNKRTRE